MTAHKPATALPWTHDDERTMRQQNAAAGGIALKVYSRQHDCNVAFVNLRVEPQDAAYIVHAANAYPKLVEALRHLLDEPTSVFTRDLARALLRELGDAE